MISAKDNNCKVVELAMSLMYIKNRIGPSIDP